MLVRLLIVSLLVISATSCQEKHNPVYGIGPPIYPTHHETPTLSVLGTLAYVDRGITCVLETGGWLVDPDSVGIWLLDGSTGSRRLFIPGGASPNWSHDGSRLVFSLAGGIYVTPADSLTLTALWVDSRHTCGFPRWGPGDRRIAVDVDDRYDQTGSTVWTMDAEGGDRRQLAPYGIGEVRFADWNASGSSLVHVRYPGDAVGTTEIYLMDSTGAGLARLTYNDRDDRLPKFSPDGNRIAFARQDSRHFDIGIMAADGTGVRRLTTEGGTMPEWTPDGREILYVRDNHNANSPGDGVIWAVNPATGAKRQVTTRRAQACP